MESGELQRWFETYVETFARCARGESDDVERLLDYYAVPLIITSDDGVVTRASAEEVVGSLRPQLAVLRDDDYERSEILEAHVEPLNRHAAIFSGLFSRLRRDGSEIARFRTTYLIVDDEPGRRIVAMALHGSR